MSNTPVWRKASRSDTQGHACVELADLGGKVGVRDSKNPDAGHLALAAESFADLMARAKRGDLTLP